MVLVLSRNAASRKASSTLTSQIWCANQKDEAVKKGTGERVIGDINISWQGNGYRMKALVTGPRCWLNKRNAFVSLVC